MLILVTAPACPALSGRLSASGSLVLGMGLPFSVGLGAAKNISLFIKIVLAICN